jgi:hypothetical protein
MAKKNRAVGHYGGSAWAFNRLRDDALVQLLNDLTMAQMNGLDFATCKLVKDALAMAVNCATGIPDGSFLTRPIWKDMRKFEITYHSWNEPKSPEPDAIAHRGNELQRLRNIRHKLARRTRRNLAIIERDLDIQMIKDVYTGFGNLVTCAPEIFKNLASALNRFSRAF